MNLCLGRTMPARRDGVCVLSDEHRIWEGRQIGWVSGVKGFMGWCCDTCCLRLMEEQRQRYKARQGR